MAVVPSERRSYLNENGDIFLIPRPNYVPKSIRQGMTTNPMYDPPLELESPTDAAAERQVSSFFRFLQDDQMDNFDEHTRPPPTGNTKRRGRPNHPLIAACFCAVQLAIGFGFIAFGSFRSNQIISKLKNVTGEYPHDTLESVISAGAITEIGVFLLASGIIGAIGFLSNWTGIKLAHLLLATITIMFSIYGTIFSSYELVQVPSSNKNKPLFIAILVLAALASITVLSATILQAAYSLSPTRGKFKQRPNKAYVIFSFIILIVCSAMLVISAIGLEKAISDENDQDTEQIAKLKRRMTISPVIVGLYVWCWALMAIGASLLRSRALSFALVVLSAPPIMVIMEQIVSGYPELLFRMVDGKKETNFGLYLAVFILCVIIELLYFITVPIVGFFVFVE